MGKRTLPPSHPCCSCKVRGRLPAPRQGNGRAGRAGAATPPGGRRGAGLFARRRTRAGEAGARTRTCEREPRPGAIADPGSCPGRAAAWGGLCPLTRWGWAARGGHPASRPCSRLGVSSPGAREGASGPGGCGRQPQARARGPARARGSSLLARPGGGRASPRAAPGAFSGDALLWLRVGFVRCSRVFTCDEGPSACMAEWNPLPHRPGPGRARSIVSASPRGALVPAPAFSARPLLL